MNYFQTLFSEKRSNIIECDGVTYYRFWPIQVNGTIKFKLRFIQSKSKFNQAIVLSFPNGFNGIVSIMGNSFPIKKTLFPIINFWEDSSPREFEVMIEKFYGEIKVCNGSDPIGTKQFCKHLSEGCAMIVQKKNSLKYCFDCKDHEYQGVCDNLVFELEIIE